MEKIAVSVIIPTHNSAATAGRAIESAMHQNVPVEIIVVDDCSTDNMEEVLEKYSDIPGVRILRNDRKLGVAASRNRGVAAARGAYVAFLDSDDWWEAGKLRAQLKLVRRERAVLCCTGRELMRADGTSTGRTIPVKPRITYRSLLHQNSINCSSVLLRADVAREFPMEHDEVHEDYITWLKILRRYGAAAGIPHPYLKYRLTEHSKSGSKLRSAKMTYRVYRYMGYGRLRSAWYFTCYALHGVWKYAFGSRLHRGRG